MKKQIKFQKILALVSLIISAVAFVFALIFFSGNLSRDSGGGRGGILYYYSAYEATVYDGADCFITPAQTFISVLVIFAIINIVVTATLFITSSNSRRNYYVTNYVSIGLTIAFSVFIGFYILINMFVLMSIFYNQVDWVGLADATKELAEKQAPAVSKSPAMFIIGIFVALIVIANAVAWILNLIWKIKLMKGEKELLEKGLIKEVA